jgi:hypothetical protein
VFLAHALPLRRANVSEIAFARHPANDANKFVNFTVHGRSYGLFLRAQES